MTSGHAALRAAGPAALIALAAACQSPSALTRVTVQTQAALYQPGASVGFSALNNSDRWLYISRCCSAPAVGLDRWQDSAWVSYRSAACEATCPMDAFDLPPRVAYVGQTVVADTGRYRLLEGLATSSSGQVDWLASNSFEVR